MSPLMAGFVCGAGLVAGLASCSRIGNPDVASLTLTCAPAPRTVQCRLLALSRDAGRPPRDVTATAAWHLSGLAGARMAPDGRLTAPDNVEGDVRVEAEFESHRAHVHARVRRTGPGEVLGVLRGRVYLAVGNTLRPVPLAHIEVVGGTNHGLTTSTDQDGAYELVALIPGDIVIRASKPGCTAAEGSIEVLAGENRLSLLIERLPTAAATLL